MLNVNTRTIKLLYRAKFTVAFNNVAHPHKIAQKYFRVYIVPQKIRQQKLLFARRASSKWNQILNKFTIHGRTEYSSESRIAQIMYADRRFSAHNLPNKSYSLHFTWLASNYSYIWTPQHCLQTNNSYSDQTVRRTFQYKCTKFWH